MLAGAQEQAYGYGAVEPPVDPLHQVRHPFTRRAFWERWSRLSVPEGRAERLKREMFSRTLPLGLVGSSSPLCCCVCASQLERG